MANHIALDEPAVGHPHRVGHDRDEPSSAPDSRCDDRPLLRSVTYVGPHRMRRCTVAGIRVAFGTHMDGATAGAATGDDATAARRRSRAALTKPTNSGWGRVGRDRSSGCAWVATK